VGSPRGGDKRQIGQFPSQLACRSLQVLEQVAVPAEQVDDRLRSFCAIEIAQRLSSGQRQLRRVIGSRELSG